MCEYGGGLPSPATVTAPGRNCSRSLRVVVGSPLLEESTMQISRRAIGSMAATLAGIIGIVAWRETARSQQQDPPQDQLPRFAPSGQLLPPIGWEAWVMVGSSTGLSYAAPLPPAAGGAPGMFHNVYVQPWAYREFVRTGAFPERTMFVLSFYEASRKSAPARAGFY